jgi:filamentous hemagglutinin
MQILSLGDMAIGAQTLLNTNAHFSYEIQEIPGQLQFDPAVTQKRLGDAFYERQKINQQILSLTGQSRLPNATNDDQQTQTLMDAGIAFGRANGLKLGDALTAEQIQALTQNIVWIEQQAVKLADGTEQNVLVPRVYLAKTTVKLSDQGNLITAKNIDLQASGDITNSDAIVEQAIKLNQYLNNLLNLS